MPNGVFYVKATLSSGNEVISDKTIVTYSQRTLSLNESELVHEGEMELKKITFKFNEEGVFEGRFIAVRINDTTVPATVENITNNSVTFVFEETRLHRRY